MLRLTLRGLLWGAAILGGLVATLGGATWTLFFVLWALGVLASIFVQLIEARASRAWIAFRARVARNRRERTHSGESRGALEGA